MQQKIIGLAILLAGASQIIEAQWIEQKTAHYGIFYQSGYDQDARFTQTWLDRAEDLLKSKYAVPYTGFYISVYLHPAPTQNAATSLANLQCCSKESDGTKTGGIKTGTISYLAPSAPAWKDSEGRTSLGLPKDDDYHAKVLMSEYITIGHYVVQESRVPTGGWRYYSAPEWFVQGLQEYDGIFHTSEKNRTITAAALFNWARNRPSTFTCCSPGLAISEPYNGGATFMAFLAAQFGEDIHRRLLLDTSASFDAAFEKLTKPYSPSELFEKFQAWLAKTASAE
jgi:hypothetical protein